MNGKSGSGINPEGKNYPKEYVKSPNFLDVWSTLSQEAKEAVYTAPIILSSDVKYTLVPNLIDLALKYLEKRDMLSQDEKNAITKILNGGE